MYDFALAAVVALLAAIVVLLGFIYHRTRTLLHWTRAAHRRTAIADRKAAHRWQEEQTRPFLAHLLQIEPAALPPFGPWVAYADFLTLIAQHVLSAKPGTIVEFGSGASTIVLLRCLELNGSGTLVSFDHDADYAKITRQRAELLGYRPDIRVVGLRSIEGHAGLWYGAAELPAEIDCLIVDGPPRTIHPETRQGAASLFDRVSANGLIFLDDAGRPGEKAVVERLKQAHPEIAFRYVATAKGTAIGEKVGTAQLPLDEERSKDS